MAGKITNDKQLLEAFKPAFQKACHYVAEKIYETNREVVKRVVYDAGEPEEYERTGEFLESWAVTKDNFDNNRYAYAKFYHRPAAMHTGSPDYGSPNYAQHVGVMGDYYGRASKEYLADIIYQGLSGSAFGSGYWTKARNAWEVLIKDIGKMKIRAWFEEAMKAQGIELHRHRTTSIRYVED